MTLRTTALALVSAAALTACGSKNLDTAAPADAEQGLVAPEQLVSLEELMDALETGRDVHATLYYGICLLEGVPGPEAIGGMDIDTYEWFAEGVVYNDQEYVAFSKSSLILIGNEHLYDYVKVRVYADNTVEIIAEYLDPQTMAVEMYEEFECTLDQGDGEGSVTLHAY